MRTVAVLCVAERSVYTTLPGVEAYPPSRDVRTFTGGMPVVAHPPCRTWSAYTAHQAKAPPGEKELGPLCVEFLKQNGGVLEHPAHSRLFKHCGLPMPGQTIGNLKTVAVQQAWWGYPMRKATWLLFCASNVDAYVASLNFPFREHSSRSGEGDRRRQQRMSKNQRAATHPALADWLLDAARKAVLI
jgi:hypothetical protein